MKVLLTGHTGYIGSVAVPMLLDNAAATARGSARVPSLAGGSEQPTTRPRERGVLVLCSCSTADEQVPLI